MTIWKQSLASPRKIGMQEVYGMEGISWPKISVVMPSFNHAPFIERSIRSVVDQHYPNLEFGIVDGGSTDGTAEIIERYRGRISWSVSETDDGQTDALIKGFRRSTGDIQCWLCSDDLFERHTLREVATFFMRNQAIEAIYGNSWWIGPDDQPIRPKKEHGFSRFIWIHGHNYLPQPSTFWLRKLYDRVGGLDPSYQLAMDADLWIRFAAATNLRHVPRVWSRMRNYPEQKNRRLRKLSDLEDAKIRAPFRQGKARWHLGSNRILARGMRIGWKGVTGCYW